MLWANPTKSKQLIRPEKKKSEQIEEHLMIFNTHKWNSGALQKPEQLKTLLILRKLVTIMKAIIVC